jgi:hypothetical protein
VADLSPTDRRGVGAGTLFIALEMAITVGAIITLTFYDSTLTTIAIIYTIGAGMALVAILYLLWHIRTQESKT